MHRGRSFMGAKGIFVAIAVCGILALGLVFGFGQKRRDTQTRPRTVGGSEAGGTTKLRANGDLQAAINAAKCNETIELEAGASYVAAPQQSFVLPNKSPC